MAPILRGALLVGALRGTELASDPADNPSNLLLAEHTSRHACSRLRSEGQAVVLGCRGG